jgi:hypothetical protein
MVSNWAWIRATLTSGGRSESVVWMKRCSRSISRSATCCGGGDTKAVLPGRVPSIQFSQVPQLNTQVFDWPVGEQAK